MKFGVLLAPFLIFSAFAADTLVIEQIIAKVNGEIITKSEIDRTKRQLEEELKKRFAKEPTLPQMLAEKDRESLRDRIDQLLLQQKGKELTINVDSEVSKNLADIQRRSKISDPEEFQKFVREQTGQSFEDYKAEMKNGIVTRRVIGQEVSSRVNIPKTEVRKFYDENKDKFQREERIFLREIFLGTDGKDAAQ